MADPNFESYYGVTQPTDVVVEHLDRVRAERIYFEHVRPRLIESARKRKPYTARDQRCHTLHEQALSKGIDVDNVLADTDAKLEALERVMKYRSLRGVKSLDEATPAMIGEVYKKDFYSAEHLR
jgi:hypothetical protein